MILNSHGNHVSTTVLSGTKMSYITYESTSDTTPSIGKKIKANYIKTMYQNPFYLTKKTSNNALSFEERKNPTLYVPSVIEGDLEDVKIGKEVVFEDFDEYEKLQSCIGLENFVKLPHPETQKPIVVVDNHNHVFYFWYEAWHQGFFERGITLVHIDAHRDTRIPERNLRSEEAHDLNKVFEYTNSVLNVGNYIPPAREEGVIGGLISITSETELLAARPRGPFILNIDLDFWASEMDYIDEKMSIPHIKHWIKQAEFITFATSPFFIEQGRAIEVLHRLLN